jgi:hypothetical protein
MNGDLGDFVSEYLGSGYFALLDSPAKEYAELLLQYAVAEACRREPDFPASASAALFEEVLCEGMTRLDAPLAARQAAPALLAAFADYLATSGRYPEAREWSGWIEAAEPRYAASFREDGSVKGATVRRALPSVGRNDPCPCGSGLKYKKCCIALLG